MEADWSRNVHIRDNYVEASYGGIFAGLIRQRDLGSGEYLNHKDIMITGLLHCSGFFFNFKLAQFTLHLYVEINCLKRGLKSQTNQPLQDDDW